MKSTVTIYGEGRATVTTLYNAEVSLDPPKPFLARPLDRELGQVQFQTGGVVSPEFLRMLFGFPPAAARDAVDERLASSESLALLRGTAAAGRQFGEWAPIGMIRFFTTDRELRFAREALGLRGLKLSDPLRSGARVVTARNTEPVDFLGPRRRSTISFDLSNGS